MGVIMAKKGNCCLAAFLIVIILLGGTVAAGYFGGNYALKKYLGDEGELIQMGINNWGDLFNFISGTNKLLKEEPEISEQDKPSQQNLDSAHEELESAIIGYETGTSLLDSQGALAFKAPLKLTGGQLAALINNELTSMEENSGIKLTVAQVKLEVDPDDNDFCIITMTLAIDKDDIIKPIEDGLGPFASIVTNALGKYIYITSVNRYHAVSGEISVDSAYTGSNLFIGNGSGSAINEQIVGLLVSLFGASDKNELNSNLGNVVISAVNSVGKVSFEQSNNISYIVFDNHRNSELIAKLAVVAEINLADYANLDEANKTVLSDIKTQANNTLATLASTELSDTSTPTLSNVQSTINSIELDNTNFKTDYQANPATVDLTSFQNNINVLTALFA
jgi:hypothetical protein